HSVLICLPSTPPALSICAIRIRNSWPDCKSYGARMPVFAAEMPIRIVPAFRPPDALTLSAAASAASASTAPARAVRFLILPPFAAAEVRGHRSPSDDLRESAPALQSAAVLLSGCEAHCAAQPPSTR